MINFCECDLYELQIIKSFLRLPTRGVSFRVACVRARPQNPDNFFGIVKLPKRKIGASLFPESTYFEQHKMAPEMSRFREKIDAAIFLLGSLTNGYLLTGLWRRSLNLFFFFRKRVSSAEIIYPVFYSIMRPSP